MLPQEVEEKDCDSNSLIGLQQWAVQHNFTSCILETGQVTEAIALYLKWLSNNRKLWTIHWIEDSVCFQKNMDNKGVTICYALFIQMNKRVEKK
jgi:hypothetical protein